MESHITEWREDDFIEIKSQESLKYPLKLLAAFEVARILDEHENDKISYEQYKKFKDSQVDLALKLAAHIGLTDQMDLMQVFNAINIYYAQKYSKYCLVVFLGSTYTGYHEQVGETLEWRMQRVTTVWYVSEKRPGMSKNLAIHIEGSEVYVMKDFEDCFGLDTDFYDLSNVKKYVQRKINDF